MTMAKKVDKKEKHGKRRCGMITCIHCICNTCSLEQCDFYERIYIQED